MSIDTLDVDDALPAGLRYLKGQILDLDLHEQMPAQLWVREFGAVMQSFQDFWLNNGEDARSDRHHPNVPGYENDSLPINLETIWREKGSTAPGAADPSRRSEVMDLMGIRRQLMFPTAGMHCAALAYLPPEDGYGARAWPDPEKRRQYGLELIKAYNKWGMKVARANDRVRPVLMLYCDTVDELVPEAQEMIENNVRAVWLFSNKLPGGKSPADPELDPFWSLMEDNNIAVCLHVNLDGKIFAVDGWDHAPAFAGFKRLAEFETDPFSMAHYHTMGENFLLTMTLGGVFERHPMLRFAVTELSAVWLGPLCQRLDMWYHQDVNRTLSKGLALPNAPSFYIKRNVRCSGFEFEPVAQYIEYYGLEDVMCFSTDYPHIEGGTDPINRMYDNIKHLGEEVVEKFFVRNAQWILPD